MNDISNNDIFECLRNKAVNPNEFALGYPVNREHAFKIDLELLGLRADTLATTYLNNIASPYYHGGYTSDNVKEIEVRVMKILAKHFNLEDEFGYITYGGTEANFASIWWHRNYLYKKFDKMPTIVASQNSHYSIKKIANQLNINLIFINANNVGMDYYHLEDVIRSIDTPIILSANCGTTIDGAIDNVILIKELLEKYKSSKYKIHLDGAIYGLFVPYLEQFQNINSIFDYVDSLSFSGHKFLGAYNISGVTLSKKNYISEVFYGDDTRIKYVQNAIDLTSSGSRQGLFSLELYLLLEQSFMRNDDNQTNLYVLWKECLNRAHWFYHELSHILNDNKLLSYNQYQLNILFPAPKDDEEKLILGKKYGLMPVGDKQFSIYVFPRSTKSKLITFLNDYKILMNQNKLENGISMIFV